MVKYFELTPQQLTGEEPLPDLDSKDKKQLSTNNIKVIPIIEWDKSHDLTTATDNKTGEIATVGNISDECFALTMNDFSMEPLFPKHTILIFDPLKNAVDRSYILVKLDGKEIPIFRQILIDVDHKYLKPLNPDLNIYKMRLLSEKDQILGCLFESRINHAIDDTIEEKIK